MLRIPGSISRKKLKTIIRSFGYVPDELKETERKKNEFLKRENLVHKGKEMIDLLRKKLTIIKLESDLLEKQKVVIEPLRLRHDLDSIRYLYSR